MKKQYETEIEEFYCEHPDARPQVQDTPRVRKPKGKQEDGIFDSEAEKRYKEVNTYWNYLMLAISDNLMFFL